MADIKNRNPFEFEAANILNDDEILDYYIDDYNYSRFINTSRNIFLQGERGTGKTMALLYNSANIQYLKSKKSKIKYDFSKLGIYIPCKSPLFRKKEHLLFEEDGKYFQAIIINEHDLVLTIANSIAKSLQQIEEIYDECYSLNKELVEYFEYALNNSLPESKNFLDAVSQFTQRETYDTQKLINESKFEDSFAKALTFSSLVIPFLDCLKKIPKLSETHYLLLIDDAHDLNKYQKQAINSWIAYRDHSQFSFKVATAESSPYFLTSNGGMILEGHDFISVDMLKPYQNKESEFGKLARKIVDQRLKRYNLNKTVEDFFPTSETLIKGIETSREIVREEAKKKYPDDKGTQISDYIAKYTRAHFFKNRPARANTPPYSGFDIIVDVSTGVIRNLLDPCYWMYEAVLSTENGSTIEKIPPKIQQEILINRSNKLWERLESLSKTNTECSEIQAKEILQMFQNLMVHFKERLMSELSEPRAVTFVITSPEKENKKYLDSLLMIAIKAQLLYTRPGKEKRYGKRVAVYVPNRLLLLTHGLDPHGQYANASIKSKDLLASAKHDKKIPIPNPRKEIDNNNPTLFDK